MDKVHENVFPEVQCQENFRLLSDNLKISKNNNHIAALKEKIINKVKKKPSVWWRYIDDIFFIWEHGEESLKEFINQIN